MRLDFYELSTTHSYDEFEILYFYYSLKIYKFKNGVMSEMLQLNTHFM